MLPPSSLKSAIEQTAREEWGRILAALVKHFNDFQLAEDCLQDAIVSAMDHWQRNGIPDAPAAWLITVAKRKALDRLRRDQNFTAKQPEISYLLKTKKGHLSAALPFISLNLNPVPGGDSAEKCSPGHCNRTGTIRHVQP